MTFWVYKGTPALGLDKKPLWMQLTIILVPTAIVSLLSAAVFVPYMNKRAQQEEIAGATAITTTDNAEAGSGSTVDGSVSALHQVYSELAPGADNKKAAEANTITASASDLELDPAADSAAAVTAATTEEVTQGPAPSFKDDKKGWVMYWLNRTVLYGINQEVVNYKRERVQDMHDRAVKYENKTERVFSWLQVVTASMASFAHGANDVSNAIGPLSAVFYIWQNGTVPGKSSPVPTWILAYGGVGIQLGLVLYGYRMMRNLGNNLTHMSPARGFTMELAAIITVLLATAFGLPVSTTHCISGASVAVGLMNKDAKDVNWKLVAWMCFGWLLTLPFAGLVAGLATAFGASAPNFVPGYPA